MGGAGLNVDVYEEVWTDTSAIGRAVMLVVLMAYNTR